jgi:tRNA-dihydrouridine synthase
MLARGALGNPWLFAELLGDRAAPPATDEILDELDWLVERCVEHLGPERAGRWLRKAYPWYLERVGASKAAQEALQRAPSLHEARALLDALRAPARAQAA